jgi:hypothetical protein
MNNALFPALAGFYVLTTDGQLGHYDQARQFVLDATLTADFADYNHKFLRAYLDRPSEPDFRLGVVYQPSQKRKWGSETLALETFLLKRMYGVTGPRGNEGLTEFQKKNREQSIYRGIELFLEHRNEHFPDAVVYAPVLFDRHTTLDTYASVLDGPASATDAALPVVEVLNLLAGIPLPRRNSIPIHLLAKTLHESVIRKDVRKGVTFGLVDPSDLAASAIAFDIDSKTTQSSTPSTAIAHPRARPAATADANLHRDTTSARAMTAPVETSAFDGTVRKTASTVHPEALQTFTQFRGLSSDKLMLLARANPVYCAHGGAQLLKRGAVDRGNFYLLHGKVMLEAEDGGQQVIEGGTPRAASPISFLKPRKYTVTAVSPVSFLWVHDSLLDAIVNGNQRTRTAALADPA